MKIIVVGCGRVGRDLSQALLHEGHIVVVVDRDQAAFDNLGPRFAGQTVTGVPFDRDVLLKAGIERADGLAAVTSSDTANIVTARIAKLIYRVPQVVARLYEPRRADVYRKLGLQTISSTTWAVGHLVQMLTHTALHPVMELGSGEVAVLEFEVGPSLDGHTVQEMNVSTEIKVMAITRQGQAFIPSVGMPFKLGDTVHVAVLRNAQERFEIAIGAR